jgi:hypothetical protein
MFQVSIFAQVNTNAEKHLMSTTFSEQVITVTKELGL